MDLVNKIIFEDIVEISNRSNINDFLHVLPRSSMNLLCIHINIRSIIKNFAALEQLIFTSMRRIDVIILTEVNISGSICCLYQIHGYQMVTALRKSRKGGGIIMYVHNSHKYDIQNVNTHYFESILCTITTQSSYVANICAIYRPPNLSKNLFVDELQTTLLQFNKFTDLYLLGDTNIDLKLDNPIKHKYNNALHSLGLLRGITDHTRIELANGHLRKSCIDHIYARSRSQDLFTAAIGTTLADHRAVILACMGPHVEDVPKYKTCINNNQLSVLLNKVNWESISNLKCPILIYKNIQNNFKNCYANSKFTVKKSSKYVNQSINWINKSIINACKYRDELFNKWKKDTSDVIVKRDYNKARNYANKLINKTKNQFIKSDILENKNNPRQLWQLLNKITGKIQKSVDDVILSAFCKDKITNKIIANNFMQKFVSSVEEIRPKCTTKLLDKETYMQQKNITMRFRPAGEKDIEKIIKSLNFNKAPGIDSIRAIDIKQLSSKISKCLANLINRSVIDGKYPKTLKTGILRPIHKKGSTSNYDNYRPITILPVIDKIAEKYIAKEINTFYQKSEYITENQYGFQPNKNTTQLLSSFTDSIFNHLDKKMHVLVVFIDFSKAFDTLRHDILNETLEYSGIRGKLLNWCKDYMKDRRAIVRVAEDFSESKLVKQGTAQGSVLGPLHYLTYVNSLSNLINLCEIYQFADDTCLLATGKSVNEAIVKLQKDFDALVCWSHDMGLALNHSKTKLMYISTSQNRSCIEPKLKLHNDKCLHKNFVGSKLITCDCNFIDVVEKQKYLGLVIDDRLNWKMHINYVCDKLRGILAKLSIIKYKIPFKTLLLLYSSLAESIIDYGLSSYGRTYKSHIDKIYLLQLRILKQIVPKKIKTKFQNNYSELFKFCKVIPIHERVHKILLIENYFNDKLKCQKLYESNQLKTRNMLKPKLTLPSYNNLYGKRKLNYMIPQLINNLPNNVKDTITTKNIKNKLKQFFLDSG